MAVKTLSTNRYSQQRLNSTNIVPATAYVVTVIPAPSSIDYLVVAGGGGGGQYNAGGGGAGGLLTNTGTTIDSTTTYVVTIGGGGIGGAGGSGSAGVAGSNGFNSSLTGTSITPIIAIGGGGGGAYSAAPATSGGSGGGGGTWAGLAAGGSGTAGPPRQGYDGGSSTGASNTPPYAGNGGGGAGAPGVSGNPGAGGAGTYTTFISTSLATSAAIGQVSSSTVYFAGGGGGGGNSGSAAGGVGGGGSGSTTVGSPGTAFTGGGGGAGGGTNSGPGGQGGSGVVIIRHLNNYSTATTTGNPTIGTVSGNTVYIFTASGTIKFLPYSSSTTPPAPTWPVPIASGNDVYTQLVSTGTGALIYTLVAGNSLPAGVTLSNTGLLSGNTSVGTYTFKVSVTDAVGQSVTQTITLTVGATSGTGMSLNSVYVTDSSYVALTPTRTAVSTSGGYVSIIGTGFTPSNKVYVQGIAATTSTIVSSTQINAQLPAYNTSSQSVQQIYVVNTLTNSAGILITGFLYSVMPYWTISSSQALVGPAISASLAALSDSALVYSVSSGTLPSGLTLNTSTGLISGTVSVETSTSVVILATDLETQTNTQTFTLTVIISDPNVMYNTLLLNGETAVKPFNSDASTNTFEVSVLGDTRPSNYNPYSNGYYSNYFNGSTDYLAAPAGSAFNLTTVDFCIEMWVYPIAQSTYGALLTFDAGDYPLGFFWASAIGANILFSVGSTSAWFINSASFGTTTLNKWTHLVVTRSGSDWRTFQDGVLRSYNSNASSVGDSSGSIYIGSNGTTGYYSNAYISNLRIVKGNVPAAYQTSNTATGTTIFTPPTSPLTATAGTGTSLLTCQSPSFIDTGPIANTITKAGTPTIQSFNPFTTTSTITVPTLYSVKFNGSTDYLTAPSNAAFAFPGAFTVEGWFYWPAIPYGGTLLGTAVNGGFNFYTDGTYLGFNIYGSSNVCTVAAFPSRNVWHHVAMTRDGSNNCIIWVDGVSSATGTSSQSFVQGAWTIYGGTNAGNPGAFNGIVSNLRVVKGTALYTATFTPSTTPLTYTTGTVLLTCQDSVIRDNSSTTPVITSAGSAQPVTATPFTQVYAAPSVATPNYYSIKFPGTTNYLTTPTSSAFNIGAGDFTIEAWYNFTVLPSGGVNCNLFGFYGGTNYNPYLYIWGDGTYMLRALQVSGDIATGAHGMVTGTWYHIAVTRSGNTYTIYKNGVVLGTGTSTSIVNENKYIIFGDGGSYLNGYVSNIRVVKGLAVYTGAFTPSTSPLTLTQSSGTNIAAITNQTSLLTAQSPTIVDVSTNAFALTTVGAPSAVGVAPFVQTYTTTTPSLTYLGSTYFDGTGDYVTLPASAAFNFGTGDFTIEMWVYPTTITGNLALFSYAGDLMLLQSQSQVLVWYINGIASGWSGNTQNMPLNAWSHIACVRSGTSCVFYLNGIASTGVSTHSESLGSSTAQFSIGYRSGSSEFPGYISNFRIVKGTALYTANFAPPAQPLTATTATSLLTLQSNQAVNTSQFLDISSNSALITRNGDTNVGTFAPFGANWSNYFSSTSDYFYFTDTASFGTGDFTVECWIYPTTSGHNIIMSGTTAGNWDILTYGNQLYWHENGGNYGGVGYGTVPTNQWVHLASSRTGGFLNLYINGMRVLNSANSYNYSASASRTVGPNAGGTAPFYLSNVRFIKGTGIYSGTTITVPTAPLTAVTNTSLLTCQSPSFQDNSANAFALTTSGAPKVQRFSPFSNYSQTPTSYATKFNGSTDYITLPSGNPALQLTSNDFTLEAWVYPSAFVANGNPIFALDVNGSWYASVRFGYESAGAISLAMSTSGSTWAITISSGLGTVVLNTWQHVAVSRSGTSVRVFLNGVQQGATQTVSGSLMTSTNNWIGYLNAPSAQYVNGYISNARIIKGTAVYTANFTPSTTPLTAITNTSLLTLQDATIKDNSTNAFTLTAAGSPTPKQFNPFGYTTSSKQAYTPAVYGGSAYFDGVGDYLTTPASALNLMTGDFTVELWAYQTTAAANSGLVGINNATSSGGANFGLYLESDGKITFFIAGNTTTYTSASSVLTPGVWKHITFVRSGSNNTIYVNGVSVLTNTAASSFSGTPVITVGRLFGDNTSATFYGYISNVRIVKSTAVYNSNFVPPSAPTTAITNTTFLLGNSPAIADYSMQNNLESFGDAKISTAVKKYNNASLYFDGTGDYLSSPYNVSQALEACDFTVEAWVYRNTVGAEHNIAVTRSSAGNDGWNLRINSSNTLQFYYTGGSTVTSTGTIPATTWTHVAATRSGTTVRLFINGTIDGSATFSNGTANTQPLRIGVDNSNSTGYFNGYIDDLRITKGVARYTANFTAPTAAVLTL